MTTHLDCIFCKIVASQIPSRKAYEDDELLVFHDINPTAPVHLLVVPKEHFENLISAKPDHAALLGRMQLLAPRLAAENGAANGFRTVINNGPDGRQEVYHLHMHIMGGAHPWKRMG